MEKKFDILALGEILIDFTHNGISNQGNGLFETTGAGDTFFGSALHFVLERGLSNLQASDLKEMLTFANAAASIITTRKGALKVMPSVKEIEEYL